MCMLIVNQEGKPYPKGRLEEIEKKNPDGIGILMLDDMTVLKDITREGVENLVDRPHVVHFRYTTRGNNDVSNLHPHSCGAKGWLFHNGTIAHLGGDEISDTKEFANVLTSLPFSKWHTMFKFTGPSRFCFVSKDGEVKLIGERRNEKIKTWQKADLWTQEKGIWYSKNPVTTVNHTYNSAANSSQSKTKVSPYVSRVHPFKGALNSVSNKHLVFVYGTLRQGFGNHKAYLAQSKFLGAATTERGLALGSVTPGGLPYLCDAVDSKGNKSACQVKGEVYAVSDYVLQRLDVLEGVDYDHYRREFIDVVFDDDPGKSNIRNLLTCEAYMAGADTMESLRRLKEPKLYADYKVEFAARVDKRVKELEANDCPHNQDIKTCTRKQYYDRQTNTYTCLCNSEKRVKTSTTSH